MGGCLTIEQIVQFCHDQPTAKHPFQSRAIYTYFANAKHSNRSQQIIKAEIFSIFSLRILLKIVIVKL